MFIFVLNIIYQGFIYYVDRYADFVLTKDLYHEVTHDSPMFGLDCEMCRTTSGELEVTRVSVVNEKLEVSAGLFTANHTSHFQNFLIPKIVFKNFFHPCNK